MKVAPQTKVILNLPFTGIVEIVKKNTLVIFLKIVLMLEKKLMILFSLSKMRMLH